MSKENKRAGDSAASEGILAAVEKSLIKRRRKERRFRWIGAGAVGLGMLAVVLMFGNIISNGIHAFWQTRMLVEIHFDESAIDPSGERKMETLSRADYSGIVKSSLRALFPEVKKRKEKKALYTLASSGAPFELREMVLEDPSLIGQKRSIWIIADDEVDIWNKHGEGAGKSGVLTKLSDQQREFLKKLKAEGRT